jgi:GlpG protein
MFVLVSFGRMVERWVGTPKFALFVLLLAIGPNLLQGLAPAWMQGNPFFGGISGVLYGLFGYVWIRSSINPNLGVSIPFPIVLIFVGMIVVGLSGQVPDWPYADLCHLGGLLIGCAYGFISEQTA